MSLLDGIFGITSIFKNGVELYTRKALDFKGAWDIVDNPETGRTEINLPEGTGGGGELEEQGANTITGNATTSTAIPEGNAPNAYTFSDATSGAGNIRTKVAPQAYVAVPALATANDADHDIPLTEDGYHHLNAIVLVKLASAGTYRRIGFVVDAIRASGTVTLQGAPERTGGGDSTGIAATVTASGSNVRVNIENSTGESVSGRIHGGWFLEDVI